MKRAFYNSSISDFLNSSEDEIVGKLAKANEFSLEQTQRDSWNDEIKILKEALLDFKGNIYFEFSIPRMGERIDVLLLIEHVIFILEFKVGEKGFPAYAIDQVWDYALDLRNFHETSHDKIIAPVLIATKAADQLLELSFTHQDDKLYCPIKCNSNQLAHLIKEVLSYEDEQPIDNLIWEKGRYYPTPTIVEAAMALYRGHNVEQISRSGAEAKNLTHTTTTISDLIAYSSKNSKKSICFVTGVPGAGKTLVGLDIATKHSDSKNELYSVFLSGNGPLVKILCEALARDKVIRTKEKGEKITKKVALSEVKEFIQNVHHFRDECIKDTSNPPVEHVAIFDEAQRAWNLEQTSNFMRRRKNISDFNESESKFLISCLDRHKDWAVIVCLVGGGQEINTGEAGISEWIESVNRYFNHWDIYISPQLTDEEYGSGKVMDILKSNQNIKYKKELHLDVSMRSFRAENVSFLIKNVLDINHFEAKRALESVKEKYPIVITRDLAKAKKWLKTMASASERYGIVVSSQAERLKPHAIFVEATMDPVLWFLNPKDDTRSSYYLEDVATEFDVQGLELDWVCVTWDADFRYTPNGWVHKSFKGNKWNNINSSERKNYLKNAYRVLLTRARQGMVIVIPPGDEEDPTRIPAYYNPTFEYLKEIGFTEI